MKMLKNFLNRLFKNTEEDNVSLIKHLEEIKDNLDNDKEYNIEASKTLINMQNMFIV